MSGRLASDGSDEMNTKEVDVHLVITADDLGASLSRNRVLLLF